jgi:DNA polymerase III epsilon subunit-like protein
MYLFLDTETTGLPKDYKAPISDSANWPRLVQWAFMLYDKSGNQIKTENIIIKPDGFLIPEDAARLHGITTEKATAEGVPLDTALKAFGSLLDMAQILVGHNLEFDKNIIHSEIYRVYGKEKWFALANAKFPGRKKMICTMRSGEEFCKLPGKFEGKYKWPKLQELHRALFSEDFSEAHNSSADVQATARCFFEMKRRGIIKLL